jgi:origin recognition complex subunit 3
LASFPSQGNANISRHVEESLDKGHTDDVGNLLESDQHLYEYIMEHVRQGQQALSALSESVKVLAQIRHSLQMSPQVPVSAIWIRATSGELLGSPLLRETMLSIKKISSDKFTQLLYQLDASYEEHPTIDVRAYRSGLQDLIKNNTSSTPLRSQHDVRNESLRTTVVAQKVLLSKHKATLSEQDKTYSELVGEFHDHLERYFSKTFVDPRDLKLIEVLMYDLKSPHTEVFQPKPRFAIERALASPHDYLGCECCGPDGEKEEGASLAATQPATAILYQLYLESGSLINVSDLWSAFNTLGGNDEESESQTM